MEEEGEKMEELNSSNDRTIRPFGDPRNWYTSQSQLLDTASSSSTGQGLTEVENDNFSVELMISGHGDMQTKILYKHAAEDIVRFDTSILTCMFSFAAIGYRCLLSIEEENHIRGFLIQALRDLNIQEIDSSTFGGMIHESEELHGKYLDNDDIDGLKERSHSNSCSNTQCEKNFDFFEPKEINSGIEYGIFFLKTIVLRNGDTIYAGTNLLDLPIFLHFMNNEHIDKKIIRKYDESDEKIGYNVLDTNNEEVPITLSDIISFFEYLEGMGNTITSLNILDLTCSTIYHDRLRRRLSKEEHNNKKRKQFGGKKINLRYLPRRLTRKDKKKQINMLLKSRRLYKKGHYYTRKKVNSFQSKKSQHIINAEKIYGVNKIGATNELAKKTGCTKKALAKIINKGAGAYFSSGSRPNQTAQSWGIARLASAITSGKAAAVDYTILEKGCKPNSKALKMAKNAKKKYGHGTRRVPKVKI
jgi:hypothetical protein